MDLLVDGLYLFWLRHLTRQDFDEGELIMRRFDVRGW
jgi:hypothetical protein